MLDLTQDDFCDRPAIELHYIVKAACGVSPRWAKICCRAHAKFSRDLDMTYAKNGLVPLYQKLVQPVVGSEESVMVEIMCHAFKALS